MDHRNVAGGAHAVHQDTAQRLPSTTSPGTPLDTPRMVTRILVMSQTRSLADVKAHLSEIIDLVESEHERVVITRNGKPAAVILSTNDLESLEETLAILSAPGALQEIHEAEQEIERGEFLNAAELRAKYLTKG